MLKICMLIQNSWPAVGGMETHFVTNARLLCEMGFEVSIVTGSKYSIPELPDSKDNPRTYHCPGLTQVSTASGAFFETLACLRGIFDEIHPDVIHAHDPILAWISDLARADRKTPLVLTLHWMLEGPTANKLHRGWHSVSNREDLASFEWDFFCTIIDRCQPDAAIAVGDAFFPVLRKLGLNNQQIVRINNGVLPDAPSIGSIPDSLSRLSLSSSKHLIVIAPMRLVPVKDIETLLGALEILNEDRVRVILTGPEVPYLKDYANEIRRRIVSSKLEDSVILLDEPVRNEHMRAIYELGSVVLLTSKTEGLSIGLLEGMAAGLVPVVSDIPGNRQLVTNDLNGFIFPLSSPVALAQVLDRLIENPDLIRDMSIQARELVRNHYNARDGADKLSELYVHLTGLRQMARK